MNLIDHIVQNSGVKQTDIANRLGVSRAQVSKWKAGEQIPTARLKELCELAGLFGDDPQWALLVGTEERGSSWIEFFKYLNEIAENGPCWELDEMPEFMTPIMMKGFQELGANVPSAPPVKDADGYYDFESFDGELAAFSELVSDFIASYAPYVHWHNKYLSDLSDDYFDECSEIENAYFDIALSWTIPAIAKAAGIAQSALENVSRKAQIDLKESVAKLCRALARDGRVPTYDYFVVTRFGPNQLDDILSGLVSNEDSIEEFLPIGEQLILAELRNTNRFLRDVAEKLTAKVLT